MTNEKDIPRFFNSEQEERLEINGRGRGSGSQSETTLRNPFFPFNSCLIHQSGKQFACIYGECSNHSACFGDESVEENGEYHALRFHPSDRKIWHEQIFPDIVRFIESLSILDYQDYRFSFNHRYILPDGRVSQFLHEGTLSVKIGNKLSEMKLQQFAEIGEFKADDTMVFSIFKHSVDWGYQKIYSKVFPKLPNSLLTPRELEIINLCQEGYSSKMIADRLKLSIHTVKNHKRKSMARTSTHNITELIHVCLQNHWL